MICGACPEKRCILLYWLLLVALLAATFLPLPRLPVCQFKALTGLPCPGCGLTRSMMAISRGRFAQAYAYHPFGFVLYLILLTAVLLMGWQLCLPAGRCLITAEQALYFGTRVLIAVFVPLYVFGFVRMLLV